MKISQRQVLFGSLCGDACIQRWRSKDIVKGNPFFYEGHCLEQQSYLTWKKSLLPFDTKFTLRKLRCDIISKHSPSLWIYYNQSKLSFVKRLTRVGLLIWYLDDGNYNYENRSIDLSTLSFSYQEHILLKTLFKDKWGITAKVTYSKADNGYILRFLVEETKQLLKLWGNLIKEVPPVMQYKFGSDSAKQEIAKNKHRIRTRNYYLRRKNEAV